MRFSVFSNEFSEYVNKGFKGLGWSKWVMTGRYENLTYYLTLTRTTDDFEVQCEVPQEEFLEGRFDSIERCRAIYQALGIFP